jgi:hypothetical protein
MANPRTRGGTDPGGTAMSVTTETAQHRSAVYECAMCRAPATVTEKTGLGYCEKHWRVVHPQRLRRLLTSIHA